MINNRAGGNGAVAAKRIGDSLHNETGPSHKKNFLPRVSSYHDIINYP
jgi:hypothetical protein